MKQLVLVHFLLYFFPCWLNAQLWQNDFSNPTDWISTDLNAGSDTWVISSTTIGGSVDTINSITAGNGFAQFNSEGLCGGNHQDVTLTYYQQIDISSNEISYVEFVQHYHRKSDSVYIEFSNDGLVWESIRINKENWYYQQTSNPDTVRAAIPSSVHSAPFWMRLRFSGECGYAWLLDDIKIYEKEQYAISMNSEIRKNNFTYNLIGHCQEDTLNASIMLSNWGYEALNDLVVQTEIYVDGSLTNVLYDTVTILNPEEQISIEVTDLIHSYFNGAQLEFQFNLFNSQLIDTISRTQEVASSYRISRSADTVSGYFIGNTGSSTIGLGYSFLCSDYVCIQGADVFIPNHPDAYGKLFYFSIYRLQNNILQIQSISPDYTVIPSDGGTWLSLFFWDMAQFSPGDTAIIMYETYYNDFPIPYSQILNQDSIFSHSDSNYKQDYEGAAAMIRPIVNYAHCEICPIGISENTIPEIIISPNPSTDIIQIQNLSEPLTSIKIYSLDGREVYCDLQPDSETLSISHLQTAAYVVFVELQDGRILQAKFVKC